MLIKRLTIPLLLCVALCVHAQDSLLLRDMQFVKQADPWLTGQNAAALVRYSRANIAEAELYLQNNVGGLADYYQSPKSLQAGAQAESFCRIGPRIVAYGSVAYDNFSGRRMTGSAFIDPTRKPFDIAEDSLTNEGTKHRDTYRLTGAVGIDVWRGYALGLRLDYTAANYAKYKDLRHKNKMLDLLFTAGVYAPVTSWLSAGVSYQYHRNTESLSFRVYGRDDKIYKSLISYGAFMGRVEQFGNSGFTDKSREMPLADDRNGIQLQLGADILQGLSLYATATYEHGKGYYGSKSPYTVTYTRHTTDRSAWAGELSYQTVQSHHSIAFAMSREKTVNHAETYRELQDANEVYYYEYYDPVETGRRKWADMHIEYNGHLALRGELPTWSLHAAFERNIRTQTAFLYPYARYQKLKRNEYSAAAQRNIVLRGRSILGIRLGCSYAHGSGAPYFDGALAQPSQRQSAPSTMEAFAQREYLYLTAPQWGAHAQLSYAFLLPGTHLRLNARAAYSVRKANTHSAYWADDSRCRRETTLALGCTF